MRLPASRPGGAAASSATGPTTTRPRCPADDLAAVIRRLGLGRGRRLRRLLRHVLRAGLRRPAPRPGPQRACSTAPTRRTARSACYPTQGPAMRRAFAAVCQRSPRLPQAGGRRSWPTLQRVLAQVRAHPWRGTVVRRRRPPDEGRSSTARKLVTVAFGATYAPAFYRELTAALRSGLRRRPRAAAAAGGRGHRRRHRRRAGGRLQRGPGRRRRLPRLPAALRHDRAAGRGPRAAVRRRARPRAGTGPAPTGRSRVHEYAALRLADARLVHPLAGRRPPTTRPGRRGRPAATRTCRCWCSAASSTRSPRRPRATWSPRSSRTPGTSWSATASTSPPSGDTDDCARAGAAVVRRRSPWTPLRAACAQDVPPVRALGASPVSASARRRAQPRVARLAALDRRRPPGPLVEQLHRHRRRPPRRHLVLLRRPRRPLPARRRPPGPRAGRLRPADLGPVRRDDGRSACGFRTHGRHRRTPRHLGHPRPQARAFPPECSTVHGSGPSSRSLGRPPG